MVTNRQNKVKRKEEKGAEFLRWCKENDEEDSKVKVSQK